MVSFSFLFVFLAFSPYNLRMDVMTIFRYANECHRGKASITSHEEKWGTGSVQCCAVNKSHCSKASMTVHEGK